MKLVLMNEIILPHSGKRSLRPMAIGLLRDPRG
jgi:hypothetical protein